MLGAPEERGPLAVEGVLADVRDGQLELILIEGGGEGRRYDRGAGRRFWRRRSRLFPASTARA